MTPKLASPAELPNLIAQLEREGFYGSLHIEFRCGHVCRIVTEQSQVFDNPLRPKRNDSNERYNR